jgi:hypothetical protein
MLLIVPNGGLLAFFVYSWLLWKAYKAQLIPCSFLFATHPKIISVNMWVNMWLIVICNFGYFCDWKSHHTFFGHIYDYVVTIRFFNLLIELVFTLFSS